MKSVVIICIVAVSVLCAVLAVSCGNRQKKSETSGTGAESPFTVEDLRSKRQGMIRAEGTGKSSSVEMATQIARMNALTVLGAENNGSDACGRSHTGGQARFPRQEDRRVYCLGTD